MAGQEIVTADMEKATISGIYSSITICGNDHKSKDWVNLMRRAKRNEYSLLKQVLVDAIKGQIREGGILRRNYDAVLGIRLKDCGGEASYKTWDDIPNESVPCPCGNPNHWLIRYEDLRIDRGGLG